MVYWLKTLNLNLYLRYRQRLKSFLDFTCSADGKFEVADEVTCTTPGTWFGESGTWRGGTWHGGTWHGGTWHGGTWGLVPCFGTLVRSQRI